MLRRCTGRMRFDSGGCESGQEGGGTVCTGGRVRTPRERAVIGRRAGHHDTGNDPPSPEVRVEVGKEDGC